MDWVFLSAQPTELAETPPSEFLIFKPGINESSKGPCLFDAVAAKSVMDRYAREGVDLIVDLEHLSLDDEAIKVNRDARNALAHFKLELRADGSLWAVDVRWNTEGADRLAKRTQRYISQAMLLDKKTRRVVYLANVALVSMPATFGAPALVAASKSKTDYRDPKRRARAYVLAEKSKHGS